MPSSSSFPESTNDCIGTDLSGVERVYDFDKALKKTDWIFFPDCYDGDKQMSLREQGYPVFGEGHSGKLEMDKEFFYEQLEKVGLEVPYTYIADNFEEALKYLEDKEDKWIKPADSFSRGDFECVDEQTEIFTNEGWKYFKDIDDTATILTMDLKTRQSSFQKIDHYFKSFYNGDMYNISTTHVDMLVTPLHKFFYKNRNEDTEWKYESIESIVKTHKTHHIIIPSNHKWTGEDKKEIIIKNAYGYQSEGKDVIIPIEVWLKFAGWFVSEGCLNKAGKQHNKYRVIISQSKEKNPVKWKEIEELLISLGYNIQYETNIGFSIYNKSLWEELRKFYSEDVCFCGKVHCSHNKKIPQYIKDLSPEKIQLFLDTYLKGDGCNSGGQNKYYTSSVKLANDIQELIQKTSKGATIAIHGKKGRSHVLNGKEFINRCDAYVVSEWKSDSYILPKNIKKVSYSGFIYDVTVFPHHSVFIRRNGKCCWTGNTFHWVSKRQARRWVNDINYRLGIRCDDLRLLIQDAIKDCVCEPGYDGFCVNGLFTDNSLIGFEDKDKAYIGRVCAETPGLIKDVNTKMAPILKEMGCAGHWTTEIKVTKGGDYYFLDPTLRTPEPPGAVFDVVYSNYPEACREIAHGRLPKLKFKKKYCAEITLYSPHYENQQVCVEFPKDLKPYIKLKNHTMTDDYYTVIPNGMGGFFGGVVGIGDSAKEAKNNAIDVFKEIEAEGLDFDESAFNRIENSILEGRKYGVAI